MRPRIHAQSLIAGLLLSVTVLTTRGAEPEPVPQSPAPSVAAPESAETRRLLETSLRLQQQLQESLAASERARLEAAVAARTNTDALAAQLRTLETTMAERQARQADSLEKTAGSLLTAAALCVGAGLLALAVFVWAQLRGMNRLAAAVLDAQRMGLSQAPPQQLLAESASLQLFNSLDRLEKRIGELEHAPSPALLHESGAGTSDAGSAPSLKALIGKGQVLMNLGQHEAALACYEKALQEDPKHVDGLMKKAAALERLVRLEEALVCYDMALAIRPDFTQAQLAKASVLNQLERFTEALNCFETAIEQQRATA
jgi:tetratricopeptide (TPR) repeat protein